MDKILEALSKILPADGAKEISAAVAELLAKETQDLEAKFNTNLEEAYADMVNELKENEKVAYQGYQEAIGVIQDLRNRIDMQAAEFKKILGESNEEAFQMLQEEKAKNEKLELELYEHNQKQFEEQREFFIDKLDQFLQYKGQSIYEQARRDVMNDPRMVEHKVTLDRIVETVADYISEDDYALATSSKIEQYSKQVEDLRGKMRILEARNVRLDMENNKLNESARKNGELITESKKNEKKERAETATKVTGRGRTVTKEDTEVIKEHASVKPSETKDTSFVESFGGQDNLHALQVLSGVKKEG